MTVMSQMVFLGLGLMIGYWVRGIVDKFKFKKKKIKK